MAYHLPPSLPQIHCQKSPKPRRTCAESPCLFDLSADPCEFLDLAETMPAVTERLRRQADRYQQGMVPPRNKPADPRANPKFWNYAWVNWGDMVHPSPP